MKWFKDVNNRQIRLTHERQEHFETEHPEMSRQIEKMGKEIKIWYDSEGD